MFNWSWFETRRIEEKKLPWQIAKLLKTNFGSVDWLNPIRLANLIIHTFEMIERKTTTFSRILPTSPKSPKRSLPVGKQIGITQPVHRFYLIKVSLDKQQNKKKVLLVLFYRNLPNHWFSPEINRKHHWFSKSLAIAFWKIRCAFVNSHFAITNAHVFKYAQVFTNYHLKEPATSIVSMRCHVLANWNRIVMESISLTPESLELDQRSNLNQYNLDLFEYSVRPKWQTHWFSEPLWKAKRFVFNCSNQKWCFSTKLLTFDHHRLVYNGLLTQYIDRRPKYQHSQRIICPYHGLDLKSITFKKKHFDDSLFIWTGQQNAAI